MIVTAREFTSGAEMRAHAVAVRNRLFHPKIPKEVKAAQAQPPKVIPFMARKLPEWQSRPTHFDEHVKASRQVLELIKSGVLEITAPGRRPILQIVEEVLSDFPEFTVRDLKSSRRSNALCKARHHAVFAVHLERPDLSFPAIGRWFGGKDHTTIMHSVRKMREMRGMA